jgi:hypothetical protein
MARSPRLAALALAAALAVCAGRLAHADSLAQPLPSVASRAAALVNSLVQPVQAAGMARPAAADTIARPAQAAESRPHCTCDPAPAPAPAPAAPAPVTDADGTPITGDLSSLRPSERLVGSEQALRARFAAQMHFGTRPWLPADAAN